MGKKRSQLQPVYKRANSRFWQIRYTDPVTGKQAKYSSKTTIREKAEEIYVRDYQAAFDRKHFRAPIQWDIQKLMQWFWDSHVAVVSPNPNQKEFFQLIKRPLQAFGNVAAKALTVQQIKDYIIVRKSEKVAKSTINREMAVFRSAFNQAIKTDQMLIQNPFSKIQIFDCSDLKRNRIATPWERKLLIESSTGVLHDLIEFDFYSGLREGELRNLRWSDVYLDQRKIRVPSYKRKGQVIRFIPIFKKAQKVLERLKRDSEWVFPSPKGGQIPRNGLIHCGFPRLVAKLGIKDFRFHDIRHSFATEFYNKTRNLVAISEILGHTKYETTKIYLNLTTMDLIPSSDFDYQDKISSVENQEPEKSIEITDNQQVARLAQR